MAEQAELSTYDQIVNAVRTAQEVNDHLKMNRKELPFTEVLNMQQSIAHYLETASQLLLEGEPTQLSNFWLELLSFLDTESPAIIGVLLKFLGKAGFYSEELLASAIQLVIHFFPESKEGAVGYEKTLIGAVEDLYVAGFRYMCSLNKADNLRQAIEIWTNLQHAKEWILQHGLSWQSWSDFTRASARCFQITLIQLQTFAPSDTNDSVRQAAPDAQPSLQSIPSGILFLDRQQLLKEAETEIENLLSHSWSDNSFQYTMMTMNMVSRLSKTRPQYLNQCVQWYELMHATMPTDALTQLEAESVVKLMRYQLLHFLAALPTSSTASADLAYYDRISVLLYDCGVDDSQIKRYSTEAQRQQRTLSGGGGASRSSTNVTDERRTNDIDEDDALVSRRKRGRTAQTDHEESVAGTTLRDEDEKYDAMDKTLSNDRRRPEIGDEDEDEDDDDEAKTAAAAAAGTAVASAGSRNQMLVQDQFGLPYDLSEPKSAAVNFTANRLSDMLSLECAVELLMKFQRDVPERSPEAFLSHHFTMRHSEDGVDKQKQHLARMLAARLEAEGVGPGGGFVRQKLYELQQLVNDSSSATAANADGKIPSKEITDGGLLVAPGDQIAVVGAKSTFVGDQQSGLLVRRDSKDAGNMSTKLSSLISSTLDDEPEPPPSLDYRPSERAFELTATTEALSLLEVEKFRQELAQQSFSKPNDGTQFSRIIFADSYWVVRKSYAFLAARFGGCIRSGINSVFFSWFCKFLISPAFGLEKFGFEFVHAELCDFIRTSPRQCQSLMLQWLATEYLVFSGRYDDRLKWHSVQADQRTFGNAFQLVLDILFSTFAVTPKDSPKITTSEPTPFDNNTTEQQQLFASEAEHQQFIIDLLNRVIFIPDEAIKSLCTQQFTNIPSVSSVPSLVAAAAEPTVAGSAEVKAGRKLSTSEPQILQSNENDNNATISSSKTEPVSSNDSNKLRLFHFFMRLFKTLAISRAPQECHRYVQALTEPLYVARPDIQRMCMNEVVALHQFSVRSTAGESDSLTHIRIAIEKEAVNMLRLLEQEHPPKKLFEQQFLRSTSTPTPPASISLVGGATPVPTATPPPVAAALAWTEELVRTCSALYMKLIQHNVHLIEELGTVFVNARPPVKRDLFKAVEAPIQVLGADPEKSHVLLNFLRNCPSGSEALILKTLNLLTQNGAKPTPEMVAIAWNVYKPSQTLPSKDVRMLMPVIAGLSKQNVFDCMFDVCRLVDAKTAARDAVQIDFFDRLLFPIRNNVNYNFTALEVLTALHDVKPELGMLSYEQLGKAFRHCVELHADKFTPQIVRSFIELTIDREKLPPLFMRTLMWAMKAHQQSLLLFIISVLQGIAARGPVWLDKGTWEGYKRCLHVGMELDSKRCARLLVQLPPAQLQEILKSNMQLRKRLDAERTQTPSLLDGASAEVRAVISDPHNGWNPPPTQSLPQQQPPPKLPAQMMPKVEQQSVVESPLLPIDNTTAKLSEGNDDVKFSRSENVVGDSRSAEPKREIETVHVDVPHVAPLTREQPEPPSPVFVPTIAGNELPQVRQSPQPLPSQMPGFADVQALRPQQQVLPVVHRSRLEKSSNGNNSNGDLKQPPTSVKFKAEVGSSVDRVIGKIISMPKQQAVHHSNGPPLVTTEKRKLSGSDDFAKDSSRAAKTSKLAVTKEEETLADSPPGSKPPTKVSAHGIPLATAVGVLPVDGQQEEAKRRNEITTIVTNSSALPVMDLGPDLSSDEMVQMETFPATANPVPTHDKGLPSDAKNSPQPGVVTPPLAFRPATNTSPVIQLRDNSNTNNNRPLSIPSNSLILKSQKIERKPRAAERHHNDDDRLNQRHNSASFQASASPTRKNSEEAPAQQPLTSLKPVVPFTQLAKPKVMATRRRAVEVPQPRPTPTTLSNDNSEGDGSGNSSDSDDDTGSRKRRSRRRPSSNTSSTNSRKSNRTVVGSKSNSTGKKALTVIREEKPAASLPPRMETRRTKQA